MDLGSPASSQRWGRDPASGMGPVPRPSQPTVSATPPTLLPPRAAGQPGAPRVQIQMINSHGALGKWLEVSVP